MTGAPEAEAAGAHLLDFYRALRGPLPNPMPSEANAEMLETLALLELDRRSTAALDAQVREVGGHTVQEWKEVLAMIGCWITLEGARALSEQYHRVRAGSGGGAGAPPWEWTAAQLEKHIKPVQHGVNRCADGAAAQHCALSARQRLLTVRTVLAADVETGHVPAALLGQKEVIAKRALPAQTVVDVYGGIYTGSAENTARQCSSDALALCCGAPSGAAVPRLWQQLVADEVLTRTHAVFEPGDAELLLHEDFCDAAATGVTAYEWHCADDAFRLFADVPAFLVPAFAHMLAKIGKFLVERYAFDFCDQNEEHMADVTMAACGVGTTACLINDIDGFSRDDDTPCDANVRFEKRSVCGVPIIVVQTQREVAEGERLLLEYNWKSAMLETAKGKARAAANELRHALLTFRACVDSWNALDDSNGIYWQDCHDIRHGHQDAQLPFR